MGAGEPFKQHYDGAVDDRRRALALGADGGAFACASSARCADQRLKSLRDAFTRLLLREWDLLSHFVNNLVNRCHDGRIGLRKAGDNNVATLRYLLQCLIQASI